MILLLRDQLRIDDPEAAEKVLLGERLSNMVRSMALASLLIDLILNKKVKKHSDLLKKIEGLEQRAAWPVQRRPADQWLQLLAVYCHGVALFHLTANLRDLRVAPLETLDPAWFDQLWN